MSTITTPIRRQCERFFGVPARAESPLLSHHPVCTYSPATKSEQRKRKVSDTIGVYTSITGESGSVIYASKHTVMTVV